MKRRRRAQKSDHAALELATRRVEHWTDIYFRALDGYEADVPHWRRQALLSILEGGFVALRACIESRAVKDISWESPVVGINHPVNWNWNRRANSPASDPEIIYGSITSEEAKRKSTALKAVGRMMAETIIQVALNDLTNGVMLEKRGERYTPMISAATTVELRKIRSKKARQAALEELYEPYCLGMEEVDIDDAGQVISNTGSNFEPAIQLNGNFGDKKFFLNLLFIARPLVVDVRAKQAYYPLSIGLSLCPATSEAGADWMQELWANPGKWPKATQNAFWKGIHTSLRKMREELLPKKETEIQKAMLSVSLKLEVPVDQSDPDASNKILEKMMSQFRATGEIAEVSTIWSKPSLNTSGAKQLSSLVELVEKAASPAEKGRSLEALIKSLLETVPGFEVQLNQKTETEEIDVVVVNSNQDTRWRQSPLIFFECKNWSTVAGKNELVQFKAKLENRRGQCSVGFLVSWNGFAETVKSELMRSSTKDLVIGVISGDDLRSAARNVSFLPILQSAWSRAVME